MLHLVLYLGNRTLHVVFLGIRPVQMPGMCELKCQMY